mgnify:CR=1 FL=1
MSYQEKIQEMYQMIGEGQMLEAFDRFYHENIEMVEATGEVRSGKAFNRQFEEKWMASIQEFHGGGYNAITSNEDAKTTMVEAWSDVTFKDGNRMKLEEVAVQTWEGDQIVRERFYYNAAPMMEMQQNQK